MMNIIFVIEYKVIYSVLTKAQYLKGLSLSRQ